MLEQFQSIATLRKNKKMQRNAKKIQIFTLKLLQNHIVKMIVAKTIFKVKLK